MSFYNIEFTYIVNFDISWIMQGRIMGKFFTSVGQFCYLNWDLSDGWNTSNIARGKIVIWSRRSMPACQDARMPPWFRQSMKIVLSLSPRPALIISSGMQRHDNNLQHGDQKLTKVYFLLSPCVRAPIVPFVAWWAPHFSICISLDYPVVVLDNPLRVHSSRSGSTCGCHAHPLRK